MEIEFQGEGFLNTAALADHARRRVHYVLSHHSDCIQRIVLRLGGTNSHRGHKDMYCLIQVHLVDALAATVIDIGADVHVVIDRATDRVGRMVDERLSQTRCDRLRVAA